MRPVTTNKTNDTLGVSAEQAAEGVKPLPIQRSASGRPTVSSTWLVTEDDLDKLVENGGLITLTVQGSTHPPLFLHVEPDLKVLVDLEAKKIGESESLRNIVNSVLKIYPEAVEDGSPDGRRVIRSSTEVTARNLGFGDSTFEAWQAASEFIANTGNGEENGPVEASPNTK